MQWVPGHGVNHPPLFNAEVKEIVDLYRFSSSGLSWPVSRLEQVVYVIASSHERRAGADPDAKTDSLSDFVFKGECNWNSKRLC